MTTDYPNLAKHLREWGLDVEEHKNWQNNGRPWSRYFKPRGIIAHHTASGSKSGNFGSFGVVAYGRPGLPGPLAQILLGRNGKVILITGEGANHAGTGGPRGVIRYNRGNHDAWGIEAENNGIGEPWSAAQLQAYYRLCAALLQLMGTKDVSRVIGHKEYTSRKIDPNGINMDNFRRQVENALLAGPKGAEKPEVKVFRPHVKLSSFAPGSRNNHVPVVKYALLKKKIGSFNMKGDYRDHWGDGAIDTFKEWQRKLGYKEKGLTINGRPGKHSLNQLGINVVPEAVRNQGEIWLANVGANKKTNGNRRIKKALRQYGYGGPTMSLTPVFGKSALEAYKKFQKDIGHPYVGDFDRSTLEALGFDVLG